MDWKTYKKYTEKQWKTKRVMSLREMSNGWFKIPKGTKFNITRKYDGFGLIADPCKCCGVQVKISRVEPMALMVIK